MPYVQIAHLEDQGIPEDPTILDEFAATSDDLMECLRWWRFTDRTTIERYGSPMNNRGTEYAREEFAQPALHADILAPHFATFFHADYTHMSIQTPIGSISIYKITPTQGHPHLIVTNVQTEEIAFAVITLFRTPGIIPIKIDVVRRANQPANQQAGRAADQQADRAADRAALPAALPAMTPAALPVDLPADAPAIPPATSPMSTMNKLAMARAMLALLSQDTNENNPEEVADAVMLKAEYANIISSLEANKPAMVAEDTHDDRDAPPLTAKAAAQMANWNASVLGEDIDDSGTHHGNNAPPLTAKVAAQMADWNAPDDGVLGDDTYDASEDAGRSSSDDDENLYD